MHALCPTASSLVTRLIATGLSLLLAACAGFIPQPGPPPEATASPDSATADCQLLTLPLLAVGDTQEHEATGYPLHENDSAVDAYVEVAQRPPEQPLFGRRLLQHALRSAPGSPFLHLGDVMDLSCRSEAERITRILEAPGQVGAVLPGNHDGLMFGIYAYRLAEVALDRDAERWQRVCRRGGGQDGEQALSKGDFMRLYLDSLRRGALRGAGLPSAEGRRLSWRHPDAQAFHSAIEAEWLDGVLAADSYIAQRLRLPAAPGASRTVYLIGLDTNQAGLLTSTWDILRGQSPGSLGHVRANQIEAVRPWVTEGRQRGDLLVFAGHHNWNSLGVTSRLMLRRLMREADQPLIYLSAHTHRGFWALHRVLDAQPLLELNVSSLSDWPLAFRRLQFAWNERTQRLKLHGALLPLRPDGASAQSDAELLEAWEHQVCAPIGLDPLTLLRADLDLVRRQREQRGSLVEWAVSALAPVCETCEAPLFEHAQRYQDEMLDAILQLAAHLGGGAAGLYDVPLPAFCVEQDFADCARALQAQPVRAFADQVLLFRHKAQLVDLLSNALDRLESPRAAAYMACRAVQAARLDFEATPDDRNANRGEARRRSEQFFRVEASVGRQ
ncbi:MAG: metallophosphoesterase [Burkholderiales bacterium]|nr:metallophosphoesterase [Burkholderiales bacterium]